MISSAVRIVRASDHSLLATFGGDIQPRFRPEVGSLVRSLLRERPAFIRDLHPAYDSVLVDFDPLSGSLQEVERIMRAAIERMDVERPAPAREIDIPVCYGGVLGPDLADVARHAGFTQEEAIRAHAGATYHVAFVGFAPGFAYLTGMPPHLTIPRLATPRTSVPAGSVAIGGGQTGIYSLATPGGWRIIGRTPLRTFRPEIDPPTPFEIGDAVRFNRISPEDFAAGLTSRE